jgi:hypothetical protein
VTTATLNYNYQKAAEAILQNLRQERDRQIVAQRFGLGLPRRYTLEKIGSTFGITRERVRQIEKAATAKLKSSSSKEILEAELTLLNHLSDLGHIGSLKQVAEKIGASDPIDHSYIVFLATLAPQVEVIEDDDHFETALASLPHYSKPVVTDITKKLIKTIDEHGQPLSLASLQKQANLDISGAALENIAAISKKISNLNDSWGLNHWPSVNPRSIRDKTYLVLQQDGKPMHFTEIANRITDLGARKRNVTVQAVHNELIKDPRFVLVGRGIYALGDWGYTPGTVADIITDVLRQQSPLHKDEIVKRVLQKRQVKTTTIVLNLQEKDQFVRVAKATYALR